MQSIFKHITCIHTTAAHLCRKDTYFNASSNAWLISIKTGVMSFNLMKKPQHQDPRHRCLSFEVTHWSEHMTQLSTALFQVPSTHKMTKSASKKSPRYIFFHVSAFLYASVSHVPSDASKNQLTFYTVWFKLLKYFEQNHKTALLRHWTG